jgi:hypothetical protein
MKRLLTACFFLLSLGIGAQDYLDIGIDQAFNTASNDTQDYGAHPKPAVSINETFEEAADRNDIPYTTFNGLEGVENGYYIVMGVFSEGKNLNRTVKKLKRKGFEEAGYVTHPENGLGYVYLTYYPFGLEAVDTCVSKLNRTYTDNLWILEIENSMTIGGSSLAVLEVGDNGLVKLTNRTVEGGEIEEVPANKNAIAGTVTELVTNDLMPRALVQLLDENGIKLKETLTEDDGRFMFENLEGSTQYTLKTLKGGFFSVMATFGYSSGASNFKVFNIASSWNISLRFSVAGANTKPSRTNFRLFSLSFKI